MIGGSGLGIVSGLAASSASRIRRVSFRRYAAERNGAELEFRLLRYRVDRVIRHGVDAELFAKDIVPMHWGKAIAGTNPVGDDRRQHGAAAARSNLDRILRLDTQRRRIFGMNLHERSRVQLVQHGHLAGLGHGVPLVLQASRIQHDGPFTVRHFCRRHMRASEEDSLAVGCGKGQVRAAAVRHFPERLAHAVVQT